MENDLEYESTLQTVITYVVVYTYLASIKTIGLAGPMKICPPGIVLCTLHFLS